MIWVVYTMHTEQDMYSSVVNQIWLNHKEPRLITVALAKIWGTLFHYFYFWQLFRAIPAALCNNTVCTDPIMQNFSESSRSSWYFNPTVFRIPRIQTWHTGDPVSGSCALTETTQVRFPGSEPTQPLGVNSQCQAQAQIKWQGSDKKGIWQ